MKKKPKDGTRKRGTVIFGLRKLFGKRKKPGDGTDVLSAGFRPEDLYGIEPARMEMIRGVVGLSSRIVREIMIPRVDIIAVGSDTALKDLAKLAYEAGHSRVPVYKDSIDNIIGVLHVKELLRYLVNKPGKFNLKRIMKKPYFIPETMPLDDLLREFKKRRLHLAVAVDEYGGFGGIVTLEDVLEEIVGEISDEYDDDDLPEFRKTGKNTYDVDSRMTLEDFCDELGVDLPCDEFDTLGGFVLDLFGKIPQKEETVKHETMTFRIKDIEGTRINRIIVTVGRGEPPTAR